MRKYFQHYFALFLIMGCIGITVEIFFTAIYDTLSTGTHDLSLKGHSYIWMFPLYGLTALTFPPLMKLLSKLKWWGRGLAKGLGILIIEYIAGATLRYFTGSCPWEYKEGPHIHGLIRLDYYPLWVAFAIGTEATIRWLHPRVSSQTIS
jgi:uncharacterized membrane protein